MIWRVVRREEPVTGEADLRLLKTEAPAVCLEGEVQWPSPASMDPELRPTLRRLPEQQRGPHLHEEGQLAQVKRAPHPGAGASDNAGAGAIDPTTGVGE